LSVEIRYSAERIAVHPPATKRHHVVTVRHHHVRIPTYSRQSAETLIHIAQSAPVVEHRPLAAYDAVACGGCPDEGLWVLIVNVDVIPNCHNQLFEVLEDAAPDAIMSDVAEEAFHHVEP
jgi:hypothetical protein